MIKSLTFKLTMAFLLIGLIGAGSVALVIRQRTQSEFMRFMQNQDLTALANTLGTYYQLNGNWDGIESVLQRRSTEGVMRPGQGIRRGSIEPGLNFILISNDETILSSPNPANKGTRVSKSDLAFATPISADNEIVGWVLPVSMGDLRGRSTAEGIFLENINRAILLSAVAASVIALLLGGFLALTLTRNLRTLTEATRHIAQGELGYQVQISSEDELGELAGSFNQMSEDLERSNQLRQQMTANIAHDLRSPLAVILGYTEGLSDGKLKPGEEIFTTMYTEASHLNRLIDDLKTLSLADAGELPLYPQPVSPISLLQRVNNAFRVQADQKQITLKLVTKPDLPFIFVDVERMVQVFGNLINNAIRHTPPDGIIILTAEEVKNGIILKVIDDGEGIPAEKIPFIFERTFRGDQSRQSSENATGLGLAIVKSLVEAQGGSVAVSSSVGKGSTFSIQFPTGAQV